MEVQARAPGKIILSGEPAVVHGSTAVAASIDLYTYVSIKILPPLVKELCFYTFTLIISLHFFLLIDVVFSCICLKVVFLDMFLYWDF